MCACVAPAIPDFTWSAATDGVVDAGERPLLLPLPLPPLLPLPLLPLLPLLPPLAGCRAGRPSPPPASAQQPALTTGAACPAPLPPADGFAVVEVKVSGHHTGAALALPGLPPLQPSGRRLALETEYLKVGG